MSLSCSRSMNPSRAVQGSRPRLPAPRPLSPANRLLHPAPLPQTLQRPHIYRPCTERPCCHSGPLIPSSGSRSVSYLLGGTSPDPTPSPVLLPSPHGHTTTPPTPSVSSRRDIELVTQVSLDRWPRFAQQALAWGGPASVAVYIPCPPDHPLAGAYLAHLQRLVEDFVRTYPAAAAAAAAADADTDTAELEVETEAEAAAAGFPPLHRPSAPHPNTVAPEQSPCPPQQQHQQQHQTQQQQQQQQHGQMQSHAPLPKRTHGSSLPAPTLTVTPVHSQRLAREGAAVLPGVVPPAEEGLSYEELYPINTLRNAALGGAVSSHVFLVDGDFIPSSGLRAELLLPPYAEQGCRGSDPSSHHGLCGPSLLDLSDASPRPVMWVVPAFELTGAAATAAAATRGGASALRSDSPGPSEPPATSPQEGATSAQEVPDSERAEVPRTLEQLAACSTTGFCGGSGSGSSSSSPMQQDGGSSGSSSGSSSGGGSGNTIQGTVCAGVLRPFHCGRYPQRVPSIDYGQWWDAAVLGRGCGGAVATAAGGAAAGGHGDDGGGWGREGGDGRWVDVQYHEYFEPYGIVRKDQVPLYDERFQGYGLNKVQHAYHMAAAGFEFRLLTQHFCVTVPHARSTSYRAVFGTAADPQQRARVEQLYEKFKQEMCEQYGYRYGSDVGACS